jgi:hypothetical protein
MTVSNSPLAFDDAYAAMDTALKDTHGIRLRMADRNTAFYFRMRCHQARKIDRVQNTLTYVKGDPLHGSSQYDKLQLRIKLEEGSWWLYFEKNTVIPGMAESLTDGSEVETELPQRSIPRQINHEPMLQLAAPEMTNEKLGDAFAEVRPVEPQKVRRI